METGDHNQGGGGGGGAERGGIEVPEFRPNVPGPLLAAVPAHERWLYEEASITRQQMNWIVRQLCEGAARMEAGERAHAGLDTRLRALEQRRDAEDQRWARLTGKWSVVWGLALIAGQIALAFVAAWFLRMWEIFWPGPAKH